MYHIIMFKLLLLMGAFFMSFIQLISIFNMKISYINYHLYNSIQTILYCTVFNFRNEILSTLTAFAFIYNIKIAHRSQQKYVKVHAYLTNIIIRMPES